MSLMGVGVGYHGGRVLPTRPTPTQSGGHCSGRYGFYWNAFLFQMCFLFHTLVSEVIIYSIFREVLGLHGA